MRVEPFTKDSYVHVVKRGARGLNIFQDTSDYWRCLKSLFYLNDHFFYEQWMRDTKGKPLFTRDGWPERKPLVNILAWVLMPNHFHLLLQEITEGGISMFMQKLGQSMTLSFNEKYKNKGSIFQGSYKGKTVATDDYMRYVPLYIMVKNTFELYPNGGLREAMENFDSAWTWAINEYRFSSLADYASTRNSPIIKKGVLADFWKTPAEFKEASRDFILGGKWLE